MTGGSLGQRTGSYGSLQNSPMLHIHTTTMPILVRKQSKMLISGGSREKEKLLSRFFKFTGRRGFGMLLVVVISVIVCMSVLSAICKDEVAPADTSLFPEDVASTSIDVHITANLYVKNNTSSQVLEQDIKTISGNQIKDNNSIISTILPLMVENNTSNIVLEAQDIKTISGNQNKDNISIIPTILPIIVENKSQLLPPAVNSTTFPVPHPCENFAYPPPPTDRKRTGPRPCPVCYLPVEQAIVQMPSVPSASPVLENLTYVYEENPVRTEPLGGSDFGGYPSLTQRNDSYNIRESMNVHCGFVKGQKPGRQTGFDIDDADLFEMDQCHGVVVASAIFGKYDIIQQPKNISEAAKKSVCFYMFVDEETEAYIKNSIVLDDINKIGLWRVVVIRNLPYVDARRNGKVPKLLLHRIFPNARFSLWIDGKLELVVDPYQILERFLWRNGATFAISRHYRRFDVFEEAEANKAAAKYSNASIDFQIDFYKTEGLTPYSTTKLPITSDVPEGCVIIREHIHITNLFTCLWFNEVDRFTSRDQLSFSSVRDKIMSKADLRMNMFMDCERRNFVVQAYHRDVLEHMSPPVVISLHPPPPLSKEKPSPSITTRVEKNPVKKAPPKRGRERKSRRHRKTAAGSKDSNLI